MKWWTDARFGMFIHWGLYALPGRHEWVKRYERMNDAAYQKYFELFNPDLYVHLLDYPLKRFTLNGFGGKIKYAQFLHDRSEIQFGKPRHNVTYQESLGAEDIILILPVVKPNVGIPVIELFL